MLFSSLVFQILLNIPGVLYVLQRRVLREPIITLRTLFQRKMARQIGPLVNYTAHNYQQPCSMWPFILTWRVVKMSSCVLWQEYICAWCYWVIEMFPDIWDKSLSFKSNCNLSSLVLALGKQQYYWCQSSDQCPLTESFPSQCILFITHVLCTAYGSTRAVVHYRGINQQYLVPGKIFHNTTQVVYISLQHVLCQCVYINTESRYQWTLQYHPCHLISILLLIL